MARCYEQDPIHRALYFDAKGFLRGLLKVEDKLTMAHSVESRVPLLDNEMIDCALKLPAKLKFDKGQSKVAFRKALDGILPKSHIERRKQGFTPPDATWFRGPSRRPSSEISATCRRFRGGATSSSGASSARGTAAACAATSARCGRRCARAATW